MKKIKRKKTDASRRDFITKTVVGAGATAVTATLGPANRNTWLFDGLGAVFGGGGKEERPEH